MILSSIPTKKLNELLKEHSEKTEKFCDSIKRSNGLLKAAVFSEKPVDK